MARCADIRAFLRAREGRGLVTILLFAAALSVVAATGFYRTSLASFVANKTDEEATAMQLVDAFVN
ncbi:MAG TPA: hypothetical protein VGG57_20565 [Stellaceae bacterium]|jgi:hypothetical protein